MARRRRSPVKTMSASKFSADFFGLLKCQSPCQSHVLAGDRKLRACEAEGARFPHWLGAAQQYVRPFPIAAKGDSHRDALSEISLFADAGYLLW